MIEGGTVTVTTVVPCEAERAFRAFTDEIDAWWRRGARFRARPDRPSRMKFEQGTPGRFVEVYDDGSGDVFEHGKILDWTPFDRVVFEMRGRDFAPDERTEVEVSFEELDAGTRVTVRHHGWDSLPPDHPARHGLTGEAFLTMMRVWWGDLLVAAGAHLRKV